MVARKAVEEWYREKEGCTVSYDNLTKSEKRGASGGLNIDPLKEVERTLSPINRAGSKRRASSLGGAISIKRKEIPALKYISNEPYTD